VEASKFTEVGYVGRDVESMVRDLVDVAVNMVREEREADVEEAAQQQVEERLLDLLLPPPPQQGKPGKPGSDAQQQGESRPRAFVVGSDGWTREEQNEEGDDEQRIKERRERTREKLRTLLRDGKLEERKVDIEVTQSAPIENMMLPMCAAEGMDNIGEMLQDMLPERTKRRTVSVADARRILVQEEMDRLIDMDEVV